MDNVGRYTIERVGQQDISISDDVVVRATIFLPCEPDLSLLASIRFEDRLSCAGEKLNDDWGTWTIESTERYRVKSFDGSTWGEAETKAEEWAHGELHKLRQAVRERARKLRCA